MPENAEIQKLAQRIISEAGGKLTGRIRLQKIAYLITEAGFLNELDFAYYHYGPYSEALDRAVQKACENKLIREEEKITELGNSYYIYGAEEAEIAEDAKEWQFVQRAKVFPSVILELAATALYLYRHEGFDKGERGAAWAETERRKKFKAQEGRLRRAFEAYEALRALPAAKPLPEIPFFA